MEANFDSVSFLLDDVLPPNGLVAVLRVYLDRGARPDDNGVMCVAATIFEPDRYKRFSSEWDRMLAGIKPGGVPYFHATDFFPGAGKFKDVPPDKRNEIARYLPALINRSVTKVVAATFKEAEFNWMAPPEWREVFGSLHGVAVQMCLASIGHWCDEQGYDGPIAYFLENGDDDEADVDNRITGFKVDPDKRKHIRYFSHSWIPKGSARGLEVSDYFAWHWNKFSAETLTQLEAKEKLKRDIRLDFASLVMPNKKKYTVHRVTGQLLERFLISNGCRRKATGASAASVVPRS